MINNKPKLLHFDIETLYSKGSFFGGRWDVDILEIIDFEYVLSYAYKWADSSKTHVVALSDIDGYKPGKVTPLVKKKLLQGIWELLDEADWVCAHNGKQFDVKKLNAQFLKFGFEPPRPYKIIDTKLIAKAEFGFISNKLDDIANFLGLGHKLQTGGKDLWKKCELGDENAWKTMKKYNKQDVVLLEKVYLKLRPWAKNHPNWNAVVGAKLLCPVCGSDHTQKRGFDSTNAGGKSQVIKCLDCGKWSRKHLSDKAIVR